MIDAILLLFFAVMTIICLAIALQGYLNPIRRFGFYSFCGLAGANFGMSLVYLQNLLR